MANERRWPSWVYGTGNDPDARFSMANERTFLAWIRTAMALLAGGVAVDVVQLNVSTGVQSGLAVLVLGLGVLCAVLSWVRWARSERAMRQGRSLPASGLGAVLAAGLLIAGAVLMVAVLR
ncbi:MAG: putative rane protein [Nocardioidaceae bacterium]|nr:putative rane protein [Nocardioidaceae bacterium]